MSTIGLYDIDFNHGQHFSISLPLMKAYRKLSKEGHIVIMMKPYEKTGRFNKIFYFKDGKTKIPNSLTINTDKGKMIGYGFYGSANLLEDTALTPPDFTPYEMNMERVKNKTLFNSIRNNSIIDWREKDFAGVRPGAGITYVNDRDFMDEYDWEEIFNHFDNNINFIHTLYPDDEQLLTLMHKNYTSARIAAPITFNKDLLLELYDTKGIQISNKDVSDRYLLGFVLFCKILTKKKIGFSIIPSTPLTSRIIGWANSGQQESYEQYCKRTLGYMPIDNFHFNYKPKGILYQNPLSITPEEFKQEYLEQLT